MSRRTGSGCRPRHTAAKWTSKLYGKPHAGQEYRSRLRIKSKGWERRSCREPFPGWRVAVLACRDRGDRKAAAYVCQTSLGLPSRSSFIDRTGPPPRLRRYGAASFACIHERRMVDQRGFVPAGDEPKASRRARWGRIEKGIEGCLRPPSPFGLRWTTFAWLANRSSRARWQA